MRTAYINAALVMMIASPASAQTDPVFNQNRGNSANTNRGINQPASINYFYNNRSYSVPNNNRVVTPLSGSVIVRTPTPTRIVGNVAPYSETEYGRVVLNQIRSSIESQGGAVGSVTGPETSATRLGADNVSSISESSGQPLFQAYVEEITPDGIFKTANGQLALRGVQIEGPGRSGSSNSDFGVAVALLKQLAEDKDIFYTVSAPEKNQRNQILAVIHTEDGTELNKMIVETGFGKVVPTEFSNPQELRDLTAAEGEARNTSRGVWQATMLPQDIEPRETPVPMGNTPTPTPAP